jgi:hypothetical protein
MRIRVCAQDGGVFSLGGGLPLFTNLLEDVFPEAGAFNTLQRCSPKVVHQRWSNVEVPYKLVSYRTAPDTAPGSLVPYPKRGRRDESAGDKTYYKGCYWGGRCGRVTVKGMLQLQGYGYEAAEERVSGVGTRYP